MMTVLPVIVAKPAAPFSAPPILVASSYLNFISGPVTVFTVIVLVFVSTSVTSPVAVVAACAWPSAPDDGDGAEGAPGDGGLWPAGLCAAGPSCWACSGCALTAKTSAREASPRNTPWVRCMAASCACRRNQRTNDAVCRRHDLSLKVTTRNSAASRPILRSGFMAWVETGGVAYRRRTHP